jgi:hypothetical protein
MAETLSAIRPVQLSYWKHYAADVALALLCALAALMFSLHLSSHIDPAIYGAPADDVWFQGDLKRVVDNMVDADSNHYRTKVHPISSLVLYPLVALIRQVHPGSVVQAATLASGLFAGAWVIAFFSLLRTIGLNRFAATAFAMLAISSASFVFFFGIPELYGPGSLTLILVLLAAAWMTVHGVSQRLIVAAGAGSLAITVTNWMAALALAFLFLPKRKAALRCAQMLAIIAVFALMQKFFFPSAELFFHGAPSEETNYINQGNAGSIWQRLAAMFLHPIVMPQVLTQPGKPFFWPLLSVQYSMPGSRGLLGVAGLLLWLALLAAGLLGVRRAPSQWRRFLTVLFCTLAGQVALHLVYGEETFLYGLHFLPLILTVAALSWFTPARPIVPWAAFALAGMVFANNLSAFSEVADRVRTFSEAAERGRHLLPEREQVKRMMQERPGDVWPRGSGHVVLGTPGGSLVEKGFHEPGGSFSPAPGSFGISIWVTDHVGKLVTTSDTVPLGQLVQGFVPNTGSAVPSIRTETAEYVAIWTRFNDHDELKLIPRQADSGHRLWVMVRSAGPSGGPIRSIKRTASGVTVNDDWQVGIAPASPDAVIGSERRNSIQLQGNHLPASSEDAEGWLYSALAIDAAGATVRVTRGMPVAQSAEPFMATRYWAPAVPDARFRAMAYAQQAHLLMGLTERQTRPGDPVNYDFDWLRDAAYVISALARSGHAATAEKLVRRLAERDFFGGFGAEADAPGLAIWAIAEVSRALSDPSFDAWAWPHVRRKAAIIQQCLNDARPAGANFSGPVLNADDPMLRRPCAGALGGLIIGRMENHLPFLYVNAVSYLGLQQAAGFAERAKEQQDAARFRDAAARLASAWRGKFSASGRQSASALLELRHGILQDIVEQPRKLKRRVLIAQDWMRARQNDRTYIAAIWPTWILGPDGALRSAYARELEARWQGRRLADGGFVERPLWTYFDFAEAHQWLLLGYPERAWATLDWFARNDASPGLYAWWEGQSEENTSNRWANIRGWVAPSNVTPHYWSAAEALTLQMSMLTYVDESKAGNPVIIGAGVPREWLDHHIDSGSLVTRYGPVRWTWDRGAITVDLVQPDVPVQVAPVFGNVHVIQRIQDK